MEGAVWIGIHAVQCSAGDLCQCAIEIPPALILFLDVLPEFCVKIWSGVDLVELMVVLESGIQLFAQGLDLLIGHVGDTFQEFFNAFAVVLGILAHRPWQGRTLGLQGLHFGVFFGLFGFLLDILFLLVRHLLGFLLGLVHQSAQLGIGCSGHTHCCHGDGGNQ